MTTKVRTKYICSNCGAETLKWMGRCPQCGEWNTLEERVETPAPKSMGIPLSADLGTSSKPQKAVFHQLSWRQAGAPSYEGSGQAPGRRHCAGVRHSMGRGAGHRQVHPHSPDMPCHGVPGEGVLYCSGEESEIQVKLRAERLHVNDGSCYIYAGSSIVTS